MKSSGESEAVEADEGEVGGRVEGLYIGWQWTSLTSLPLSECELENHAAAALSLIDAV